MATNKVMAVLLVATLDLGLWRGLVRGDEAHLGKSRKFPLTEQAPIPLRCSSAKGEWCQDFLTQEPISWKPAPRGSIDCPDNCNNVGRCNHDTGYCDCPAGWRGPGCKIVQKRPCTRRQRAHDDRSTEPFSFIGPDKRDLDWTVRETIYSRCGGICDDDTAICYCDGPMGRLNAPEGSPPGTPPIRRGRPLVTNHMAPKTTADGRRAFGDIEYDHVYGPNGYCNVSTPIWNAGCGLDDLGGLHCDDPIEAFCPGACSGHGRCNLGFYFPNNRTEWTDMWVYAADTMLHELLLISEHRTFDPEEADYFYVPHAASCLPFPIGSWADYPWFKGSGGPRVRQMVNMLLETVEWIDQTYPFWKRRGGRDHVFLFTHDEGACWAPNVLINSTWLTHWGRMDLNHTSATAFLPDRYDKDFKSWQQPEGYTTHISGHPCYNPAKDLIVPAFKQPRHYRSSPLTTAASRVRDVFFFFRGDVGKNRLKGYSRGIRQRVYSLAKANGWAEKFKFLIGDGTDVQGDYSDMLSRSVFCLVAAGDGWSARLEDAVLHGCIPVIIFDNVHVVFESILDIDSFAVRLPEVDVDRILEVLQALPERKVRSKQAHLGHAWHRCGAGLRACPVTLPFFPHPPFFLRRFRYASLPGLATELRGLMEFNDAQQAPPSPPPAAGAAADEAVHFPRPFRGDPTTDDAFATILQWLHSRIPFTR
ncbi:putative glucuronosyltransferase [Tetrabaena socialis]|uniref:Putative glucuronosyltransferase n=1 Tax=Tetrabaena socialis TaxID=47790 RepID=A0A2J8AH23_9CHLO|nr:putative glucuronosyltransferase [Tetrabaena socialis]|eukprot:PNH11823.1 putative glucuronosyltransferase [Tetrabaena socialis]